MKKRGFTLVEVISVLVILSIIVIISIVLPRDNKEDEKDKLISDIKVSAEVYFSSNEILKEKIKENNGYLLLSIEELKEYGILNENLELPLLDRDDTIYNLKYDKILLKDLSLLKDKYSGIKFIEDSLNNYEIVYPYGDNQPFAFNLENITLLNEEAKDFTCNYDFNELKILNKNYQTELLNENNYECSICEINILTGVCENITNTWYAKDEKIFNDVSIDENNISVYNIIYKNKSNNDLYGYREAKVDKKVELDYSVKDSDGIDYDCTGNEYAKNVTMKYETDNLNLKYEWYKDNNKQEDLNDKNEIIINDSGTYKGVAKLESPLNKLIELQNNECKIKIDNIKPKVEIKANTATNINIKLIDNESGVKGYYISDSEILEENIKDLDFKAYYNAFNLNIDSNKDYYIYVIDKAENYNYEYYSLKDYPTIDVTPIDGTITEINAKVNSLTSDITEVKVQYVFDDKFYVAENLPGKYEDDESIIKLFIESFGYNENYTSQTNIKNITNCSGNSCEFTIDMEDAIKACNSSSTCKYTIQPQYIDNMFLKYYVYVKNSKGKVSVLSFNSKFNVYKKMLWSDLGGTYPNGKYGMNDNGDIIYTMWSRDIGDGKEWFYYYDNNDEKIYQMGDTIRLATCRWCGGSTYSSKVNYWGNDFVRFSSKSSYGNDTVLTDKTFNISTHTTSNTSKNTKLNNAGLIISSNLDSYNNYKNKEFIDWYMSIYKEWDKYTTESFCNYHTSNELKGKVAKHMDSDGQYRYSTLIKEYCWRTNVNESWGIINFKEKVTISNKNLNYK